MQKILIIILFVLLIPSNLCFASDFSITNLTVGNFQSSSSKVSFEVNYQASSLITDWIIYYQLKDSQSTTTPFAGYFQRRAFGADPTQGPEYHQTSIIALIDFNTSSFDGAYVIAYAKGADNQETYSQIYLVDKSGQLTVVSDLPIDKQSSLSSGAVIDSRDPYSSNQTQNNNVVTQDQSQVLSNDNLDYIPGVAIYCTKDKIQSNGFISHLCNFYRSDRLTNLPVPDYKSDVTNKYGDRYFISFVTIELYFKYFEIFMALVYLVFIISKIRPGGVVFDSITKKPVSGAIVRIFDAEKNKIMETKVTDNIGRYNFSIEKGSYYMTVIKPQYFFPSKKITKKAIPKYYDLYNGDIINVKSANINLNYNIPVDPNIAQDQKPQVNFVSNFIFYLIKFRYVALILASALIVVAYTVKVPQFSLIFGSTIFFLIIELYWLFISFRVIRQNKKTTPSGLSQTS